MGTRELRDKISSRIDAAHFRHEPTIITRNGESRAVLISYAVGRRAEGSNGGGDASG